MHASPSWPLLAVLALLAGPNSARPADLPEPRLNAPRVHDPSTIVKCNGEYWVFATGMGVRSFHSKDRMDWQSGPPVFTNYPAWNRDVVPGHRGYYWAPDVIRLGSWYRLYYSVSAWGKNTSAIGLASNRTLDPADPAFEWRDDGIVIQSRAQDNFNAIDPAPFQDTDGRCWLVLGSFWSGIKLVELDPATGKRLAPDSPISALAAHESIEAPYLYRRGSYHYLFVNWGLCCRGTNSTYRIRVGRSLAVTGPYLDREGKDMLANGGSLLLGNSGSIIGPGHAGLLAEGSRTWLSFHSYYGPSAASARLGLLPLHWDADEWPVVDLDRSQLK